MTLGRATRVAIGIIIAILIVVSATAAYLVISPGKTGKANLYVKDSSGIWAHVNVTFSQVQIHQSGGNTSGWKNLTFSGSRTMDLAVLVNVSALLADGKVDAGNYTQIRIIVQAVSGTMTNGTKVDFTVPSGELKTTHPFTVSAGKTTKITIDIDLTRSIVFTSSGWKFTPVLGSIDVVGPSSGGITY